MSDHLHTNERGWRGLLIPVDTDKPLEIITTKEGWRGLAEAISAPYIERVLTRLMPVLPCGCRCILVVDETGVMTHKPQNARATHWYPYAFGIHGDALMIAEGPVQGEDYVDQDFISIPEEIGLDWAGFRS